jgi:hypothetical protein
MNFFSSQKKKKNVLILMLSFVDCSGFVSAAWNVPPPGAVTYDNFPCYQIDASELRTCDALLNPAEHVALFIGWDNGQPLVMEECGHVPECCGSEATCPV